MNRRTVYINGRFLTQAFTGVQRYAFELLLAMDSQLAADPAAASAVRFEVLVPRGAAARAPALSEIGVREVGRRSGQVWEQLELALHARGAVVFNPCNAAPLFKRRRVVTLHDAAVFTWPQAYSRAFSTWYRFLFRQVCRSDSPVITVSEFSRRELVRECGLRPERSTVIHHGHEHIYRTAADASILDRLGVRNRRFALVVSSHNPTKNFAGLAKALSMLVQPDFDVVVVGGRNSRIFASDESGWPAFVKMAGYVEDAELRALYEATACFVYPSLYEGFGIPPLEALACGAPVLAGDIPPLREIYGAAVAYCDPTDPPAMARALDVAMQRPTRDEAAVKRCLEHFTWARCAAQTIDFLSKA